MVAPKRHKNTDLRTREHLTPGEVGTLIVVQDGQQVGVAPRDFQLRRRRRHVGAEHGHASRPDRGGGHVEVTRRIFTDGREWRHRIDGRVQAGRAKLTRILLMPNIIAPAVTARSGCR
jgi:hypothetical protein